MQYGNAQPCGAKKPTCRSIDARKAGALIRSSHGPVVVKLAH
jgi:hypothetical protein